MRRARRFVKLLALTKYDTMAATTRQRFLQYLPALREAGIEVDFAPLLGNAHLERLTAGRRASPLSVLTAYVGRIAALLRARRYDALWIHCEVFPFWPGIMERLAALWGKPIIYDFDDAIFHMYDASSSRLVRRLLGRKLVPLLERASACGCGNAYLRDYAVRYCPNSIILPTVVDTEQYRPRAEVGDGPLVIGWIGSPSTWAFVRPLLPMLRDLTKEHGIVVRAIGAGAAAERDAFPGLELVPWSEASEIAAVQAMDIGIMPVTDGPFERGKCGYKLIQYMACGLPVVGSPVGVNATIVEPGVSGFLATTTEEWRGALVRLVEDRDLRATMGAAGRKRVVSDFSLAGQAPRLVALFQEVVEGEGR